MHFEMIRYEDSNTVDFRGRFNLRDIEAMRLDRLDRAVIEGVSAASPPEDCLLALELIFRRHAESLAEKAREAATTPQRDSGEGQA